MIRSRLWSAVVVGALAAACGPSTEEIEEARQAELRSARADSVAEAEALYDPAAYDTISWAVADSAIARGQIVFLYSCRRCHGASGRGDGDLALEHDLAMPDLTVDEWEYDGDLEGIRHRIFVGHESEMPNWGLHGLKPRDIDAVGRYILGRLRGE